MFGRIGMGELLLIFGIVLIVFGPTKLPSLAKSMGEAIAEFKKGANQVSKEIDKMAEEVEKSTDEQPQSK
ncbi:MAG: twin-arginine translocase TatA/TatE family subunit [Oscillospiraceae bacterium]|nr:twin-arginine translocase TatA/TatE family subunit [Oscillospiraceae bacterium]